MSSPDHTQDHGSFPEPDVDTILRDAHSVDTVDFPGMMHGVTLRSAVNCGQIRSADDIVEEDDLVCIRATDLAAPGVVTLGDGDQPILASDQVRHVAEPVALIAAPDRARAARVRADFHVDCMATQPIESIELALAALTHLYAEDNVFQRYELVRGDLAAGFDEAEVVVESKIRVATSRQRRMVSGVVAIPGARGEITVIGAPPNDRLARSVADALGVEAALVTLRPLDSMACCAGGIDLAMPAIHAALLARRARRPVRLLYDDAADIAVMPSPHPAIVRHRTGLRRDGKIMARDIMIFLDGGAYTTVSREILLAAVLHAAGPYRCDNVRVRGRVVATHHPPRGVPDADAIEQITIGGELHLDRAAGQIERDPVELRRLNAMVPGDALPSGHTIAGVEPRRTLDAVASALGGADGRTSTVLSMFEPALAGADIGDRFEVATPSGRLTWRGSSPPIVAPVVVAHGARVSLDRSTGATHIETLHSAAPVRDAVAAERRLRDRRDGVSHVVVESVGEPRSEAAEVVLWGVEAARAVAVEHCTGVQFNSWPAGDAVLAKAAAVAGSGSGD